MNTFGNRRLPNESLEQRHIDIAASLQDFCERVMLHIARHLYRITECKNLCLSGGVALNCVANGKILYETPFESVFVQPAANDAGTSIGAALYYYYATTQSLARHPLNNSYLGLSYTDSEVRSLLDKKGLSYVESAQAISTTAKYLSEGKIIGWFNGRMEFGPRSLGNRSILTAPFPAEMKDILNNRVKHRESFRPFAPAVMREDCGEYFDNNFESPYMLLTYNVREEYKSKIPAVTHVDGTARVQTVEKHENPHFHALIEEFKKLTGIGVILNTSFNVMGQPIVENPEQAVECFFSTEMDYLILNAHYILSKN
jgi:carbamoyltransferase